MNVIYCLREIIKERETPVEQLVMSYDNMMTVQTQSI